MEFFIEFAGEAAEAAVGEELHGLAGVVLAEVDGLADVGVGFCPGFAGFVDDDAAEGVALGAQEGGGLQDGGGAVDLGAVAPGGEGGGGWRYGIGGLLDGGRS